MLIPLSNKQHSILLSIFGGSPVWMGSGISIGSGQSGCHIKLRGSKSLDAVHKALKAASIMGWPQSSLDAIKSKLPA
jgi:hypothetical protein